ncbi:NAD(P)H-hydrate epimerase [Aminipila terrae]|uniref:NAD(P)H-hydrate epimerase n=1 Tax=Aminipila terrae TaxID=2697030 RepID=A0A6P1MBI3_9FIRM|nr:NAD(P)H-hydrate epimerase [Aminipila terrae]QHI71211.1 NAD(P)H-hydrate epimerase [Aminipila terrae]
MLKSKEHQNQEGYVSQYLDIVTCTQMKEIEQQANEAGLSYYKMMENAGNAAVRFIVEKSQKIENRINDAIIFCGKGNNGGDGYVVARELAVRGMNVTVVMADGQPKTEDAIKNANIVLRRGIPVIDAKAYFQDIPEIVEAADIVVDAIYGTGFHGSFQKTVRDCAKLINDGSKSDTKKMVFALDIPTGLNGDVGEPDADTVVADYTIAFHRLKPVHRLKEASPYCGEVVVASIGID